MPDERAPRSSPQFLVARTDRAKAFQSVKEDLDQIALTVERSFDAATLYLRVGLLQITGFIPWARTKATNRSESYAYPPGARAHAQRAGAASETQ
jgi:hypothetical protein